MKDFSLGRTAFKAHTEQEASHHRDFIKKKSWKERLEIAAYLNSNAFTFPVNDPPRVDKK